LKCSPLKPKSLYRPMGPTSFRKLVTSKAKRPSALPQTTAPVGTTILGRPSSFLNGKERKQSLNPPAIAERPPHRGASNEIARVRNHPSPPTRRGNRKGHGRVFGDQWAGAGLRGPISARFTETERRRVCDLSVSNPRVSAL
jgi:hypothetical protein